MPFLSELNLRHQTSNLFTPLRQRINQNHKLPFRHPIRDLDRLLHLDLLVLFHRALLVDVVVALEQVAEVLVALQERDLAAVVQAELDGDEGVRARGDVGGGGAGGGDEEIGAAGDWEDGLVSGLVLEERVGWRMEIGGWESGICCRGTLKSSDAKQEQKLMHDK